MTHSIMIKKLGQLLKHHDCGYVNRYQGYIDKLCTNRKKDGTLVNPWAQKISNETWVEYYEKVALTGLRIDGDVVIVTSRGITLTHQAYKNLVLQKYPDAKFDIQLVRDDDAPVEFTKIDGKIHYDHKILKPFSNSPIIGGYCIIKLPTGDFLETMSKADFEQIKRCATDKTIWNMWEQEMCMKSLIKRACKRHFRDLTVEVDKIDNENYDFDTSSSNVLLEEINTKLQGTSDIPSLNTLWKECAASLQDKEQRLAAVEAFSLRKQELVSLQAKELMEGSNHDNT